MVKDYARKNATQNPQKHTKHRLIAIFFIIIALCGFLPVLFYYAFYHPSTHNKTKALSLSAKTNKANNHIKKTYDATQFDFYTLLPKMKVVIPAQNPGTNTMLPGTTKQGTYVLQVASLQNLSDAEKLREQLINLGYHAYVQNFHSQHNVWYRVLIGPYLSLNQAEIDQRKLHQQDMDSLLLRMNIKS